MADVKTVKTYRITHHQMRVGDEVRHFGDLIPEAANFENLRAYLNAGQIEEYWCPQSEIDKFIEDIPKRVKAQQKEREAELGEQNGSDADSGENKPKTTKKKRVAKKAPAKKVVAKKKGKTSGKELAEESV